MPTPPASSAPHPHSYQGAIVGLYGDVLHGWAWNPSQPDVQLAVEVYLDGVYAELTRADKFQPFWKEGEPGDGFHGFTVRLRSAWLGSASQITARIANHGPWLDGAIQMAEPASEAPEPALSQVWYSGGLQVTGWARDASDPKKVLEVIAREGETVLARTHAGHPHFALANLTSSEHGFRLDLPWSVADGKPRTVHIEDLEGRPLAGSPIQVCYHAAGMGSLLGLIAEDAGQRAYADSVLRDYERRAPLAVSFAHYAEWLAVFQKPAEMAADAAVRKAGVLLYGEGDADDVARSRASVEAQRWPVAAIEQAETDRLPQAVHRLLSAGAEAIIPLHVGDRLAPHAVDTLLAELEPDAAQWLYADCDRDGAEGERTAPWFKPGWDVNLFMGADLYVPGTAWSAGLARAALALGDFPPGGGIDDVAAVMAAAAVQAGAQMVHVPWMLYHRRPDAPASPAEGPGNPQRQSAMQWLANRIAHGAKVIPNGRYPALQHIVWPLPSTLPRVSLIVPTRDQVKLLRACVEGLLEKTDYPDLEIIVVDNDSTHPDTLAYLESLPARGVRVLPHPYPFNYATINNMAVAAATGSVVGLINNDIEVLDASWLKAMVAQLHQPGVGAVGAKLLWPNGMVQHAGVVVGMNGLAAHTGNLWRADDAGYLGLNQVARQQSAVTAACLLVRKALYDESAGLDDYRYPVAFNDVDFCLRIRQHGERIVWTPLATLIHAESASRGKEDSPEKRARAQREQHLFIEKWANLVYVDPYYHPALNHDWANGPYNALHGNPATPARLAARKTIP